MARGENVFQRKDGRFEARYIKGRRADGKPIYGFCYGKTYEEAREKAVQAGGRAESSSGRENSAGNTMACFCDEWLHINRNRLKPSSHAKYRADIENHIKPFFGQKQPRDILPEEVDVFTRMLLDEKKLSPKTVRSILVLFHSVLCYVKSRLGEEPKAMDIHYPKNQKKSTRVLNKKEESALLRILGEEMDLDKFGIYLALRTGMRIGEVCALRWRDISMESEIIAVCHTVQRLPLETGDTGTEERKDTCRMHGKTALSMGTPKSDSSVRLIPLMPDIAALCERFRTESQEDFVLTGTDKCMEPRKLQRRLKKYLEECSIEEAHFHTLRHTFATRCVEAGFDVKTLSEILGHSNISITLNQYVHPNMDLKRENMSRLKSVIPL
ncbi:MAG TPA: site-specific integrase [Lachnospiraceae bacterium]|nr:site-specific integrase [Lachnospiraceae bacterium]